jgi:hypothetical protein
MRDHERIKRKQQALYQANSLRVLQGARVVAMTTTGVALNQDLVAAMRPRVSGQELAELQAHALVVVCDCLSGADLAPGWCVLKGAAPGLGGRAQDACRGLLSTMCLHVM